MFEVRSGSVKRVLAEVVVVVEGGLLTPDSGRGHFMTSLLMTSPGSGCCWTGSPQRHWGPSRARRAKAGAG